MEPPEFALESVSRRFRGAHESSAGAGRDFLRHVLDKDFGGTVDGWNFSEPSRSVRRESSRSFHLHLLDSEPRRTSGSWLLPRAWTQCRRQDGNYDRIHAGRFGSRKKREARSAFPRLARQMGTLHREISHRPSTPRTGHLPKQYSYP